MARYTLKTFYGKKELERFEHRSPDKLHNILTQPRFARDYEPFGEPVQHSNRFEIYNSQRERIFDGRLQDTLYFIHTL